MRKLFSMLGMFGILLTLSACGDTGAGCSGLFCDNSSGMNESTGRYVSDDVSYLNKDSMYKIDGHPKYDAFGAVIPVEEVEKLRVAKKWKSSNVTTEWHQYHGHVVRVDMLDSNRDLREMRLRFFYNDHDGYIQGNIGHSIDQVAQYVIRQACGRNASDALIVYDRPSMEVDRPSPFYDWEVVAKGVSVREYGFRCLYADDRERGWLAGEAGCR